MPPILPAVAKKQRDTSIGTLQAGTLLAEPATVAQERDLVEGILDDAGIDHARRFKGCARMIL